MRRSQGLVMLVVLFLLAGCNGIGGVESTERETLTPAPVGQVSPSDSAADRQVAPGLTRDTLVDPAELLRRHENRLNNRSHASRREVVRRASNGTIRSVVVTTVESNETAVRIQQSGTEGAGANGTVHIVDRWSTDNVTYTSMSRGNETSYRVSEVVGTDRQRIQVRSYWPSLIQILAQLPLEVEDPKRRDTVEYPIVTAEERDLGPLRNVSFTGTVTENGVITEYMLLYEVEQDGTIVRVSVRYGVTVVQTAPHRPDWLGTARNETSEAGS